MEADFETQVLNRPYASFRLYNPEAEVPSAADYREGFSLIPADFVS